MDGFTIFDRIRLERRAQDLKWGEQNHHPLNWLAILIEEVGEVGTAIIEGDIGEYVKEMYHVAAVAVAALECAARGKTASEPGIVSLQQQVKALQDALDAQAKPPATEGKEE